MNLAILNYGMGNLGSVRRVCTELGANVILAEHPDQLIEADKIIIPGVGAFSEGMARLQSAGLVEAIYQQVIAEKKPLLGICLGMQLLASSSEEGGLVSGLNLIPGHVKRLDKSGCQLRIPHVGWNDITLTTRDSLLAGIPSGTDFYFVHSFSFLPTNPKRITAWVDYGSEITAAISDQHIFGVQFHPEKSSKAGRRLLQNFLEYKLC